ncbi:Zinc finger CCCH domain-containing protein 45 [Raphanus sativus]|uniref:Zinc finger CCCH domain-containing protein 45 isoform X2 n=1 Tax=Raphanus sativus TaxID=3726 RepID=A0A9W3C2S5_RAPSA|nr:zinc finger CCCH domain-containing protein 45 isoform X2 [Raphanus sativus]KAJ4890181.1 Zinc finger CCCH domain-containing protein 45 [Raphanus sativus]
MNITKRSKKSRVSWPSGPKLCQVKVFRTEDCPAKVASQPQRLNYPKQSPGKRQVPDLPPGFEGNHYADKLSVSTIPRIKWKRPRKFLVSDAWLMGDGGESTERRTENLRISKVLEAIYPHRSTIPSRPSVSPLVEAESFDDSKTPAIRLTPIEDESDSSEESSNTCLESGFTASKQVSLETKPLPCSIQELASGLAPHLSLAASAALSALMKTNEQGSMIDPDLLIKLLRDPEMIKNLITDDASGKSSETKNQHLETNNVNHTRIVPQQHVTALPMTKPKPTIVPQKQSVAPSQPITNHEQKRASPPKPEQRRVSPPKPVNQKIFPLNQINRNPVSSIPMSVQPSLPPRLPSSSLPMDINHQRPPHVFSEPKVTMNPQPQPQHNSAYRTPEMKIVQAPVDFGRGPQTGFNNYPMNFNRTDVNGRPKPVVQPMKSDDYFKNLIRQHGTVNHETNQYHSQNGKFSGRIDQNKVQKQCVYNGTPRGCQMGDSCVYVHDRLRPNFEAEAPMAKRLKFGRYDRNGF